MTDSTQIHQFLQAGIAAAKTGQTDRARQLLAQSVRLDPSNEQAWLWLSQVVSSVDQRADCLRRVLAINPDNTIARRGLAMLMDELALAPSLTLVQESLSSASPRSGKDNHRAQDSLSVPLRRNLLLVGIGVGFLISLVIILASGLWLFYSSGNWAEPGLETPIAVAATSGPIPILAPPTHSPTASPTHEPVINFLYQDSLLLLLPTVFDLPADFQVDKKGALATQAVPPLWPQETDDKALFDEWHLLESASMYAARGGFLAGASVKVEVARFADAAGAQAALDHWLTNYVPPDHGIAAEPPLGDAAYALQSRPIDPRAADPLFGVQGAMLVYRRGNVLIGVQSLSRTGATDLNLAYVIATRVDECLLAASSVVSRDADLRLLLPEATSAPAGFELYEAFSGWVNNQLAGEQAALIEARETLAETAAGEEPNPEALLGALGLMVGGGAEQAAHFESLGRVTGYVLSYANYADPYSPSLLTSYVSVYTSTEAASGSFAEQVGDVLVSPLVGSVDIEGALVTDRQVADESRIISGTTETSEVIWAVTFRREAFIANVIYVGMAELTDFETVVALAELVDDRIQSRGWETFFLPVVPPLIVTPVASLPPIETVLLTPDNVQVVLPFEEWGTAPILSPQGTYMVTFGQMTYAKVAVVNRATDDQIVIGTVGLGSEAYGVSRVGWLANDLLYVYSRPTAGDRDRFHEIIDLTTGKRVLVETHCIGPHPECWVADDAETARTLLGTTQVVYYSPDFQSLDGYTTGMILGVGSEQAYAIIAPDLATQDGLLEGIDYQEVWIHTMSRGQIVRDDVEVTSAMGSYRAILDYDAAEIAIYTADGSLLDTVAGADFWDQPVYYPGTCQVIPQTWEPDESALWIGVECSGEINPDDWDPTEVYYSALVKFVVSGE